MYRCNATVAFTHVTKAIIINFLSESSSISYFVQIVYQSRVCLEFVNNVLHALNMFFFSDLP